MQYRFVDFENNAFKSLENCYFYTRFYSIHCKFESFIIQFRKQIIEIRSLEHSFLDLEQTFVEKTPMKSRLPDFGITSKIDSPENIL